MLVLNKLITWLVELPVLPPWWWTRPGFFQDSAQIWGAVVGRFYVFWCDNYFWLVVWNMNFMNFHILGISSSQLTFIFFQSGRYTTNQLFMCLDLRFQMTSDNTFDGLSTGWLDGFEHRRWQRVPATAATGSAFLKLCRFAGLDLQLWNSIHNGSRIVHLNKSQYISIISQYFL